MSFREEGSESMEYGVGGEGDKGTGAGGCMVLLVQLISNHISHGICRDE